MIRARPAEQGGGWRAHAPRPAAAASEPCGRWTRRPRSARHSSTTASKAPRARKRLEVRHEVGVAAPGDERAMLRARAECRAAWCRKSTSAGSARRLRRARRPRAPRRSAPNGTAARGCRRSDVPSANSTTDTPSARRLTISAMASPVCWRRERSTKTVRCSRAVVPTSGQLPTSALRHKCNRHDRTDDENVGPGHVVGDEQDGVVADRLAVDANADAENLAQHAIVTRGDEAPARQAELTEQPLNRDQQRRHA